MPKRNSAPLIDDAARFDPAAVTLDDPVGQCQADAGTGKVFHAMQPLEHAK